MKNQESTVVSTAEFVLGVLSHKTGFLVNIGNDGDVDHSFELFSSYYSDVKKINDWLSFSNDNPTVDKETGKQTFPIEGIGEFSLNINVKKRRPD